MSFRGMNQVLNLYKKRGKIREMTNPTPLGWGRERADNWL